MPAPTTRSRSVVAPVVAALLALLAVHPAPGEPEAPDAPAVPESLVRLHLDADFTHAHASARAIELGVRTALESLGGTIAGRPAELVRADHHGNTRRSRRNLEAFLADPDGLAVIGGMHSPPLLANRAFINREGVLLLDPWAAAGPITRAEAGETNWIFRLSIDDANAGAFIADRAIERDGHQRPYLLLEDTGWGASNRGTMLDAIERHLGAPAPVALFPWGIGDRRAQQLVAEAIESKADAILLVANAPEAARIVRAMAARPASERLPFYCHWGLLGGDFFEEVGPHTLDATDLMVIQTRAIDHGTGTADRIAEAWTTAIRLDALLPEVPRGLPSLVGFVHAHDLMLLLDAAVRQAGPHATRDDVRRALESLEAPVHGLLGVHHRPFAPWTPSDPDAHEALGPRDYRMARIGADGRLRVITAPDEDPPVVAGVRPEDDG